MHFSFKKKYFFQLFFDLFFVCLTFLLFLKIQYLHYEDRHLTLFTLIVSHYKALILFCFSWYFISVKVKLYNIGRYDSNIYVIRRCIYQVFLFSIIVFAVSGLKTNNLFSVELSLYFLLSILIVMLIVKLMVLSFVRKKTKHNKVVFIDENENTSDLIYAFIKNNRFREVRIFLENPKEEHENLYNLESITDYINTNKVKVLFLSLGGKLANQIELLLNNYKYKSDMQIVFIPDHGYDLWGDKFDIKYYNNVYPILILNNSNYVFNRYAKRCFDLYFSILVSIFLLSWLIPICSLLIRLTSKGPIFYTQERIGLYGKSFKIIKFRSMYTDAEVHGPKLSSDNDSRITSVGKIMRKYRIDELPQFINVIKGDMSVVGPRPERQYFIDKICEISPRYKELHSVKPGITSLGQVYFGYAETLQEMAKRLKYDLLYLNNANTLFDFKIIWLTIIVVFKGKGK